MDRLWRSVRNQVTTYADASSSEESSENNFEDGLDFGNGVEDEYDESIAGIIRRDSIEREVNQAGEDLNNSLVPTRGEGNREHFSPVQVRFPVNALPLRPPPDPPIMVDYDQQNTADGEKASELARSVRVEFDSTNIKFWFSQLEAEMLMAGIGQQWLKKTVLQRNLPNKQKEDVMAYLTLTQTEAGNRIYHEIKKRTHTNICPKTKRVLL